MRHRSRLDTLERKFQGGRRDEPRSVQQMTDAELVAIVCHGNNLRPEDLTDERLATIVAEGRNA